MSTQLQLRRGTTAQHSTFTGASGEITIDTDKKTVVVHDGTTAGGRALPQFDSSGNLGIGTTSPAAKLSVYGPVDTTNSCATFTCSNNDASGITLKVRSSYGYATSRSWAIWNNYSAAGTLEFLRSTSADGAPTTSAMTLDSSGNLLVGTTSTINYGKMSVYATSEAIDIKTDAGATKYPLVFFNGDNQVGVVITSTTSTTYSTSSDYRLKEDFQPVATPIDRLNQLKPVNFAWKLNGERCDGFLAHELQEVIPEAATGTKDETKIEEYEVTPAIKDEEGNVITEAVMGEREVPVYQGIDQSKIVPLLTAALQEAVAKIESLTQRIEALEYTKQGE